MTYRAIVVTTSVTLIASYNERRISLTVLNAGPEEVFISINQSRIIEDGFPLSPGMTITLTREDGDNPEYAFYAQAKAGYAELRIQEGVV